MFVACTLSFEYLKDLSRFGWLISNCASFRVFHSLGDLIERL